MKISKITHNRSLFQPILLKLTTILRTAEKKVWEPEIARAKAGESVLLFVDAVPQKGKHCVQAAFLGFLWCFERIFIQSPSERRCWNVLGAYDVVDGRMDERDKRQLYYGNGGL